SLPNMNPSVSPNFATLTFRIQNRRPMLRTTLVAVYLGLTSVAFAKPPPDATDAAKAIAEWPIGPSADGYVESPEEASTRKWDIALAALAGSSTRGPIPQRQLLALILVTWHGESRFALDVHRGEPGIWGSDDGRAACLGQLHSNARLPREAWEATKGTDIEATTNCAMATARALQSAAATCRYDGSERSIHRTLRQYGSGTGDCNPALASDLSLSRILKRTTRAMR